MLELKNIKKSYKTGEFEQQALTDVSLSFRKNEFVAILGPSGSGKTTLLNIIGGLDRYDSGDLIINGKSTKQFKSRDWDAYRNNCVGFVFQNYNLIGHISVLANVEMGMTLSGVSKRKRHQKALEVLDKVGLKDHVHKKPNQLSGGQMQRVAIARALANDPDIILADEPTGALDSVTSVQIMDLIQDIAKDKLVIMVTHNPELANTYANRIVEFKDGSLMHDSNPVKKGKDADYEFKIKKTAMSFLTALKLSFNNIMTKKGRTILTAFASSIGIIGIALILALSNGFNIEVENFEKSAVSSLPIVITEQAMSLDEESMMKMHDGMTGKEYEKYPTKEVIYAQKKMEEMTHTNILTQEYLDYIEKINPNYVSGVSYARATSINALVKTEKGISPFNNAYFTVLPRSLDENQNSVMEDNYDLLKGAWPKNKEDLILVVDRSNRVSSELLTLLGLDPTKEEFTFDDLLNKEIKVVFNDDYYQAIGQYFTVNLDFEKLYQNKNNITLKITGIARGKEGNALVSSGSGLAYTEALVDSVVAGNEKSAIVTSQQEKEYNVLTGEKIDITTEEGKKEKEQLLSYLGADSVPVAVQIYSRDFESKDEILSYLDQYNENKEESDKILYTDTAELLSTLSGSIMDAITIVLIAFSSISLVVSCIMIGIITYISVLERTKEIGVLRALGARKKDITRVFNAETVIIGFCSGALGLLIARLLIFPANSIIENLSELPNVAKMNPIHAIILLLISMLLTVIGGAIPAFLASKKDPVEALRTE